MPLFTTCPGCQASLRVREEYAGKQIKCPRCSAPIRVSLASQDSNQPTLMATVGEEIPTVLPVRPAQEARERRRESERSRRRPRWQPCPRCGSEEAERVTWTPWGSFYGPALLTHVRCPDCGYAYNGRSGRSNFLGIFFFSLIPFLLLVGLNFLMWIAFAEQAAWALYALLALQGVVVFVMLVVGLVGMLRKSSTRK